MTNFSDLFNQQLSSIGDTGKAALATEQSKAQWQQMQNQAEMNAGYTTNWTPGASSDNKGAKAVSIAMTAYQNGTKYAWGGNSLTGGVDCSGLVQQVYKQLGINVPRTTYQQAKFGKKVPLSNLLPGDLVFYNTGGLDPNGIGNLSHVAIYIGNGQIIDARNSRAGIKVGSMNVMGGAVMAVRPW
jgi:cell wall-associated NlpC family hydrolase